MAVASHSYEAVVNGVVGAVYHYVKSRRSDGRSLAFYGLEKAVINFASSYASYMFASDPVSGLDVEYLLGAVLAGLYHSRDSMNAAGDQLVVSIISHLISSYSATAGTTWFQRNIYGTTGTAPSGTNP